MSLIDDLECVIQGRYPGALKDSQQYQRLRAFIEQHEPWLPPRQPGFGPWIEYKPGDKGPRINDVVGIVSEYDRKHKDYGHVVCSAQQWPWHEKNTENAIVAYCVKEDTP